MLSTGTSCLRPRSWKCRTCRYRRALPAFLLGRDEPSVERDSAGSLRQQASALDTVHLKDQKPLDARSQPQPMQCAPNRGS